MSKPNTVKVAMPLSLAKRLEALAVRKGITIAEALVLICQKRC